jgi:hypothetical protein
MVYICSVSTFSRTLEFLICTLFNAFDNIPLVFRLLWVGLHSWDSFEYLKEKIGLKNRITTDFDNFEASAQYTFGHCNTFDAFLGFKLVIRSLLKQNALPLITEICKLFQQTTLFNSVSI